MNLPSIKALIIALTAMFLLAACSDGDGDADSILQPGQPAGLGTPVVIPADGSAQGAGAAIAPERAREVDGEITDIEGNTIRLAAWTEWPAAMTEFDPYGREEVALFGALAAGRPGDRVVVVFAEVCASEDQAPDLELFRARFQPISEDADLTTSAYSSAAVILQPVVSPQLTWPAAGDCATGWVPMRWSGAGDPDFQYTAISSKDSTFGDAYVYAWRNLEARDVAFEAPSLGAETDMALLDAGSPGAVTEGPLDGWEATVTGWVEVPDSEGLVGRTGAPYLQPVTGARFIAVQMEICTDGGGALPSFGLQVDGWNLLSFYRRSGAWGPGFDPLDINSDGQCSTGWMPFEVPVGSEPTGFWIAASGDLSAPWLSWVLTAEQLELPEVEGFPEPAEVVAAEDACGVDSSELLITAVTDEAASWGFDASFDVTQSVAVLVSGGRVDLYLGSTPFGPEDIPTPAEDGVRRVQATIQNLGESIEPGDYSNDVTSQLFAEVRVAEGGSAGLFIFDDVSVRVTSIDESRICGEFVQGAGEDEIAGGFAVPFWTEE